MTTRHCTSCGAANPTESAFCGSCGTAMTAAATATAAPTPTAAPTAPPASAAPTPPAAAPTATAPTPQAVPPVPTPPTPQVPVPPAPAGPRPPGSGGNKGMLAIIFVIVALALGGFGAYKVLSGPDAPPTPAPAPVPPEPVPPQPQPEPIPPQPQPQPPEGNSVLDLLYETVGQFQLAAIEEDAAMLGIGATEAYWLVYQSPSGQQLGHGIGAFRDAESANDVFAAVAGYLMENNYELAQHLELTGEQGQYIGQAAVLIGPDTQVLWTNHNLFILAVGFGDDPIDFFNTLPY